MSIFSTSRWPCLLILVGFIIVCTLTAFVFLYPDDDKRLAKAVSKGSRLGTPVVLGGKLEYQEQPSFGVRFHAPLPKHTVRELGFLNVAPKDDAGVVRENPLIIAYEGKPVYSFALKVAALFLEKAEDKILSILESHLGIDGSMEIDYNKPERFPTYSMGEVSNENFDSNNLVGKIVLVGATDTLATELKDSYGIPTGRQISGVELQGYIVASILRCVDAQGEIVIVSIDKDRQSYDKLPKVSGKLRRSVYAALVERLLKTQPKVVGIDVYFTERIAFTPLAPWRYPTFLFDGVFFIAILAYIGREWMKKKEREESQRAYDLLAKSIFKVIDKTPGEQAVSTGFFITKDGYALTCFHVLPRAVREGQSNVVEIEYKGQSLDALYIAQFSKPGADIAVLKVDGTNFTPAQLSREWKPDAPVLCLGYQEQDSFPNAVPIYAHIHRHHPVMSVRFVDGSSQECLHLTFEDIRIEEGTSGGPILNRITGRIIAIATGTQRRTISGIAIPATGPGHTPGTLRIDIDDISQPRGFGILISEVYEHWHELGTSCSLWKLVR